MGDYVNVAVFLSVSGQLRTRADSNSQPRALSHGLKPLARSHLQTWSAQILSNPPDTNGRKTCSRRSNPVFGPWFGDSRRRGFVPSPSGQSRENRPEADRNRAEGLSTSRSV